MGSYIMVSSTNRSLDCRVGVWQDSGEEISCKGCEHIQWTNHSAPPCKLCYNFVGVDVEGTEPFIITAKSTSTTPAKRFLNHYFLKKLRGKDLPLYVYRTRLGLDCPQGTYSVLTFERGPANSPQDIRTFAKVTKELLASTRLDFSFEQPEEAEVVEEGEASGEESLPF